MFATGVSTRHKHYHSVIHGASWAMSNERDVVVRVVKKAGFCWSCAAPSAYSVPVSAIKIKRIRNDHSTLLNHGNWMKMKTFSWIDYTVQKGHCMESTGGNKIM
jgi:hypothetical protein